MTAHVDRDKTGLQIFDSNLTLRRPIRDVSLSDFNWLANKAVYANPVHVTRLYSGVKEQRAEQSFTSAPKR